MTVTVYNFNKIVMKEKIFTGIQLTPLQIFQNISEISIAIVNVVIEEKNVRPRI